MKGVDLHPCRSRGLFFSANPFVWLTIILYGHKLTGRSVPLLPQPVIPLELGAFTNSANAMTVAGRCVLCHEKYLVMLAIEEIINQAVGRTIRPTAKGHGSTQKAKTLLFFG